MSRIVRTLLTRRVAGLAVLLALVGLGCSGTPSAGADAGAGHDGLGSGSDGGGGSGAWVFVREDNGQETSAVALELEGVKGDEATLKVVARGLSELHSVAFRLVFDPKAVTVTRQELGAVWGGAQGRMISRFAVRPEGELWAGIGHVGKGAVRANAAASVARVTVKLSGAGPIELGFRAKHNAALAPALGTTYKPVWLGGMFKRSGS